MKEKFLQLYEEMLISTEFGGFEGSYFPEWVEHCFCVSVRAGARLKEMLERNRFSDEVEEQWFYTELQPQFSGKLEYYTLVYTAELFVPKDQDKKMEYWNRELGKTWNFLMGQECFYLSFIRGGAEDTPEYKDDPGAYGNLVAKILAREKYMGYIQDKLAQLRGRRQNSLFLRA